MIGHADAHIATSAYHSRLRSTPMRTAERAQCGPPANGKEAAAEQARALMPWARERVLA